MRETRRFIVDTLAHYPELKLEWLSIGDDDRVERIHRKTDLPNDKQKNKKKGKGKNVLPDTLAAADTEDGYPVFPDDRWDEESDSDEDDDNQSQSLKLDLIDNIAFYDVWGVKIFKKEIMMARL